MESEEVEDEETNWIKSRKETRELQWINGEIQSKINLKEIN